VSRKNDDTSMRNELAKFFKQKLFVRALNRVYYLGVG